MINSIAIFGSIVITNHKIKLLSLLLFAIIPFSLLSKPKIELQSGHTGAVNCISFAGNDKYFATGSSDNTIKVWNKESGLLICTLKGHTGEITNLAFSATGDTLISSSLDKTIKIWEVKSNTLLTTLAGNQTSITDIAIHPYSRIILSSSLDEIRTWDITNAKTIEKWKTGIEINTIEYSQDGELYAYPDKENNINLKLTKSISSERKGTLLQGHKSKILDIKFNSDNSLIASIDDGNNIIVWDLKKTKILSNFKGYSQKISFSKEGKNSIATVDSINHNIIINDFTGRQIKKINTSGEDIICIDFSNDGDFLVTGTISGQIDLWDLRNSKNIFNISSLRNPIKGILYSEKINNIITANSDSYIKFWDLNNFQAPFFIKSNLSNISNLRMSSDGSLMSVAGLGFYGNIEIYNIAEKKLLKRISIDTDIIHQSGLSKDNNLLFLVDNFSIKLYDLTKDSIISEFPCNPRAKALFHPKKDLLYMHINNEIQCYDIKNEELSFSLKTNLYDPVDLFLSCTHDTLFSIGKNSELISINLINEKVISIPYYDKNTTGAISCIFQYCPQRINSINKIAVGQENNSISILENFTEIFRISQAHSNSIDVCTFAMSDSILISGSNDGLIKIWNLKKEAELLATLFSENLNWVVLSNSGKFDGSVEGIKKLHYVKDFDCLPLETYYRNYYSSMLLSSLFSTQEETEGIVTSGLTLPPKLRILSPLYLDSTNINKFNITIEVNTETLPLSEIRIYYNEKLVRKDLLPVPKTKTILRDYPCYLFPGKNEFKVIAYDINGNESIPATKSIIHLADKQKQNLFIVAIGISEYDDTKNNLQFAKIDAQSISEAFNEPWIREKMNVKTYTLYDKDCNRDNLKTILKKVTESADYNDHFIFFFSGHGVSHNINFDTQNEFSLLINSNANDKNNLFTASEFAEIIENIKASNQLIMIDACHSSLAGEKIKRDRLAKIARDAGFSLFFSSGIDKKAYEQDLLGHGLFSYTILEGLSGKADNGDKKIMTLEMQSFIGLTLPALSKELIGKEQIPVLRTDGNDFVLYYLKP